jgi:hypothetical protein
MVILNPHLIGIFGKQSTGAAPLYQQSDPNTLLTPFAMSLHKSFRLRRFIVSAVFLGTLAVAASGCSHKACGSATFGKNVPEQPVEQKDDRI